MAKRFLVILIVSALIGCSQSSGEALPQLGIDVEQTSASGLSAGAYMAGQLQVAHSNQMIGAALIAGGPYGCAQSGTGVLPAAARNLARALEGCMADKLRSDGIPNVAELEQRAKALAKEGKIDPLTGLQSDKVYLFSGGADQIVAPSIVQAAKDFYVQAGVDESNVMFDTHKEAGHAFLTTDSGERCGLPLHPM